MTKQNVEVNVNMVNVEGVSGVNNTSNNSPSMHGIRISKDTHDKLTGLKLLLKYNSMDDIVSESLDLFIDKLDDNLKLKYKLFCELQGSND